MKDELTTKNFDKDIINIENLDLTNKKALLNSPRSIESIRILGYNLSDLYFITFKEFTDMRVDLKSSGKEIQLKRYNHFEEKRQIKVNDVIEKRRELMKGDFEGFNSTVSKILKASKTTKNFYSNNVFNPENDSTAVQQDKLKLEKLKQKEINDLQSIIDYEFQLEDIRENNRKKMELQRMKEEKIKEEKMKKIMEENKKRKFKELEKQMRNRAEEERTKKALEEREELDRQKQYEERMKKEKQDEEYRRKQHEQKIKDEEFKRQIEEIFISQQNKLVERQKSMNDKDVYRKNLIEKKKAEIVEKSKKKSESDQIKIEKTIRKVEQKLEQQRNDFEKRQVALEDTRKKFLTSKEEHKNYQNLLSRYKELEVKKILERNVDLERVKVEKYNKKKEEVQKRRQVKEEEEKRSLSEKLVANQLRQKRIVDSMSRFEKKKEDYRLSLIGKLNEINTRIAIKKEDYKKGLITKFDNIAMAREDKYERVMLYEKQQQYLRDLMMENINDRMRKIDEMKKQKNLIAEEKRKVVDNIKRKKKEMLEELEFKLHKGKLKKKKEEFYNKLTQVLGGSVGDKLMSSSKSISKSPILETNQIMDTNEEKLIDFDQNLDKSEEISEIKVNQVNGKNEENEKNLTADDANMSVKSTENNESNSKKKISDYKAQLDHKLYDLITKCNIKENNMIKQIKKIENSEEKQEFEEKLILLKEENERKIATQKEKNRSLVAEYEKSLI